jgi:hypothetical protein
MAPPTDRETILSNLRTQTDNGQIIVGAGAGIGTYLNPQNNIFQTTSSFDQASLQSSSKPAART